MGSFLLYSCFTDGADSVIIDSKTLYLRKGSIMENRIAWDGETYSERESNSQEYDNSNIIDLQTEQESTLQSAPKVSANISADITSEHIKELCEGVRKSKETITVLDAYKDQLLLDSLTSEDRENVMRHMDSVVKMHHQSKLAHDKNTRIWKIILASGASAFLYFVGRGFYLKHRSK